MTVLVILMALIMFFGAIWTIISTDIFKSIIVSGIVSLMASVMFLLMEAPDVAITEAAIGSAMTTALFIFSYKKLEARKK